MKADGEGSLEGLPGSASLLEVGDLIRHARQDYGSHLLGNPGMQWQLPEGPTFALWVSAVSLTLLGAKGMLACCAVQALTLVPVPQPVTWLTCFGVCP